jgi:RNA polymerase sigma factor (sigma-70 family)
VVEKHHAASLLVNICPVLAILRKKRKISEKACASYFLSISDGGGGHLTTADQGRTEPAGVTATITALYECYAEELRFFLTGVLRNADLADEALQNTFAKAVESGHTARQESIKGWLFQVGFREALLLRRRGKVHDRSLRAMSLRATARGQSSDEFAPPDERILRGETVERVRRALAELPPEQRQVVEMRIYEDKTFAAIADELSAPLGTILTRMRLAVKRLSRQLGSEQG